MLKVSPVAILFSTQYQVKYTLVLPGWIDVRMLLIYIKTNKPSWLAIVYKIILLYRNILLQKQYAYKVKIINPKKKSEMVVRHLHDVQTRFESIVVLRHKLIQLLGEQVPKTLTFDVGYYEGQYEGQQHSKIWLC